MFSQTVEYALRAVVHLGFQYPNGDTTQRIAEATRVPGPYLAKVMQALRDAKMVKTQRGLGGGMRLLRPPEEIAILDVVNAVEPVKRIRHCPLELSSHGTNLCPLHRRMDAALAHVEEALGATTLAEVLNEPGQVRPLCDVTNPE